LAYADSPSNDVTHQHAVHQQRDFRSCTIRIPLDLADALKRAASRRAPSVALHAVLYLGFVVGTVVSAIRTCMRHACEQDSQHSSTKTMSLRPGTADTFRTCPWALPHAGHCGLIGMASPEDGLLHSDRGFFATTPLRNQLKTRTNRYTDGTTQFKRISNMSFSVDG